MVGKKIHIVLHEELHRRLRVRCAYEATTIQDYVAQLIARDIEMREPVEGIRKTEITTKRRQPRK